MVVDCVIEAWYYIMTSRDSIWDIIQLEGGNNVPKKLPSKKDGMVFKGCML